LQKKQWEVDLPEVTLARDASRLTASGWRIATLDLLDLFPNTHHVETLSSFERAR
jgi:hypothetical protein